MKNICFFCHFHNGDIFHVKSFIKDITSKIDTEYYIAHPNSEIITCDMDLQYINIPLSWSKFTEQYQENRKLYEDHVNLLLGKEHTKFIETDDCFYINTWIGGYFGNENEYNGECSLRGFYRMFSKIYEKLNEVFNTNLELGQLNDYLPFVDYSKIDCSEVDKFLENNNNQKILICNGPACSGQTTYNGNMSEIIVPLAEQNEDKTFICTQKFDTELNNIKFSNDIINSNSCDLNEISYLSKFCYLIVGRNSGPFCFSTTYENLNNKDKTFLAFGTRATDCLAYEMDINSSFVFEYFNSVDDLYKSISELV
jgi:hypothetical protein